MLVVVGGHSRNIGKTSVIAGLIRAIPEARWTAVKITQYGHGVCSTAGEACDCAIDYDHPYALSQERDVSSGTDSSRYLAAGAERSFWLRTATGQLGGALPILRGLISGVNSIIESNSLLTLFKPDVYIVVLDFSIPDFKRSSLQTLDRADALVILDHGLEQPCWPGVSPMLWRRKRKFHVAPPQYCPPELSQSVRKCLAQGV